MFLTNVIGTSILAHSFVCSSNHINVIFQFPIIIPTTRHPGSRGPLRKLGQKLKRGSQIEPYRLFHSFNGLPFTILIHFRSDKARRKPFGGPFLVLVSNFFKNFSVESNSSCIRVHPASAKIWHNNILVSWQPGPVLAANKRYRVRFH